MKTVRTVLVLLLTIVSGCTSSGYGVTKGAKEGYFQFYGSYAAMGKYENFLCSKREKKCVEYIATLIDGLIESDQSFYRSCKSRVSILEQTIYVDESATTHVQFVCEGFLDQMTETVPP